MNILPPRVVSTEAGNTIFYKNRFLYSKWNPSKQIERLVSSLVPIEKTLFIFASPVLGYGVSDLLSKIPSNSFLLFCEYDPNLGKIFEQYCVESLHSDIQSKMNIGYICANDIDQILRYIEELTHFNFKKVQLIRGSAGVSIYEGFYTSLLRIIENALSDFLKNRITLIEMGRLYSRNIFKWFNRLVENACNDEIKRFCILKRAVVDKPILVIGAGPSLDSAYSFIKKNRNNLFLLVVDVALPALLELGISPDGVVLLEGQHWVEYAFLDCKMENINLFASITSASHVFNITSGNIFLCGTNFAHLSFLKQLKHSIKNIPFFEPMGSVGLFALQIAIFISKVGGTIFHTGLDFSWGCGYSHARSSMPVKNVLINTNRLVGLYRGDSLFTNATFTIFGKGQYKVVSTNILSTYASIYKEKFSAIPNIFDIGNSGLCLKESILNLNEVEHLIEKYICEHFPNSKLSAIFESENNEFINESEIALLLRHEKEKLQKLKDMLIGAEKFQSVEFVAILKTCDYLYLHFPEYPMLDDKRMLSLSFLKRIRIELEYFLKIML